MSISWWGLVITLMAFGKDTAISSSPWTGFERPLPLVEKGAGRSVNNVLVDGCSPNAAFQLVQVSKHVEAHLKKPKKKRPSQPGAPAGCDRELEMNKGLVDFVNRNMENCVREGWNAHTASRPELADNPMGKVRFFHEGCMGDARHQTTPSWHNHGLAWDISAIEIGGTPLWFMKGENVAFFSAFRQCWGEAVKSFDNSCSTRTGKSRSRASKPAGTIGKEDKNHQNHLHLSLPCKKLLKNPKQRMYMAGGNR